MSLIALAFLLFSTGCDAKQQDSGAPESVTIAVPTIQCSMCVTNVKGALTALDGVEKADVDLDKKLATVQFASASITLEKMEIAITKAGYKANERAADPEAYEALPDCCKIGE